MRGKLKAVISKAREAWPHWNAYAYAFLLSVLATSFLPVTPIGGVLGGALWKYLLVGLLQYFVIEKILIPELERSTIPKIREWIAVGALLAIAAIVVLANLYLVEVTGNARILCYIALFFGVTLLSALTFSIVSALRR